MAKRPYTPRLERQLDGSANQSFDCGRAVTVMLVDFATRGRIRPTTEAIGRRMDRPTGPSNSGNQKKAVESYDAEAKWFYLRPLKCSRRRGADWEDAVKALEDGAMLSVDTKYGVFHNQYNGKYACSKSFHGLHSVAIWGRKRINGKWMTRLYDPLADGRYKGCWNGPRWVPLALIRKATARVWGPNKWGGGVVKYAPRLPRAEEEALRKEREKLRGVVAEKQAALDSAFEELASNRDDLSALEFALSEARDSMEYIKKQLESQLTGVVIDISGVIEEMERAMPPNTDNAAADSEDGIDEVPGVEETSPQG
jgi:hypothetical protein